MWARDRLVGAERLHDTGPGLRQIAAVIPAPAEREHPTLAVPVSQRRKLERRAGMTGTRELKVGERIASDTVSTTLQDDKLRRKMF